MGVRNCRMRVLHNEDTYSIVLSCNIHGDKDMVTVQGYLRQIDRALWYRAESAEQA
jgi:hypothetical protein